jgi:hypothetical protein
MDYKLKNSDIVNKIKEFIEANKANERSCKVPHEFTIPVDRNDPYEELLEPTLFCKWKCVKCGYIQDSIGKAWYEKGLEHGSK